MVWLVLKQTFFHMDVAAEPTGTYLRRVWGNTSYASWL